MMVMMSRDSMMMVLAGTWTEKVLVETCNSKRYIFFLFLMSYLVHDTEDNSVDEADSRHPNQTQQEQISITVQLEVCLFRVEDGAHELAFLCAEPCRNTSLLLFSELNL